MYEYKYITSSLSALLKLCCDLLWPIFIRTHQLLKMESASCFCNVLYSQPWSTVKSHTSILCAVRCQSLRPGSTHTLGSTVFIEDFNTELKTLKTNWEVGSSCFEFIFGSVKIFLSPFEMFYTSSMRSLCCPGLIHSVSLQASALRRRTLVGRFTATSIRQPLRQMSLCIQKMGTPLASL